MIMMAGRRREVQDEHAARLISAASDSPAAEPRQRIGEMRTLPGSGTFVEIGLQHRGSEPMMP